VPCCRQESWWTTQFFTSYRASHASAQHLLVSGLSAAYAMFASKTQKNFLRLVNGHLQDFGSRTRNAVDETSRVGSGERQTHINASVSGCHTILAASSGVLVRNPVATTTASISSVRVAMLYRTSRKTTLEAALQNVT
jgi:hypothetical protein